MADKVGVFLAGWRQLTDKKDGLATLAKKDLKPVLTCEAGKTRVNSDISKFPDVYKNVQLYSWYSYLFYYPTMHWALDRTPETDDYWVGIFKRGAGDKDYITHRYIGKTAQGSHHIGILSRFGGLESTDRYDEFELRIFKGAYQRVDAETNILRGRVLSPPSNPLAGKGEGATVDLPPVEPEIRDFIQAIEASLTGRVTTHDRLDLDELQKCWDEFTYEQQQLLYPILEQDCLPDEIKRPGPKDLSRPEPKLLYANLGETKPLLAADDPASAPNTIVLNITINHSYTYVYPVVNTCQFIPAKYAYLGVFHTKRDWSYSPKGYIDNDYQWVGYGYQEKTHLNYIREYAEGPLHNHYVGAIFTGIDSSKYVQIGIAAQTIAATISATPKEPPPFKPDFDKDIALRNARLSKLAYKPYSDVERELPKYGLKAEMQIYDTGTDTNGFIASDRSSIVVAFRGTESAKNILTDLWFCKVPIVTGGPLVHSGFVSAFNTVYTAIEEKLEPDLGKKELFITGHSLGAALASLLTYRISRAYPASHPHTYVYGCPPVGEKKFAIHFSLMVSNTITIEGDPISTGVLLMLAPWVGLYKPVKVQYLPRAAGHGINNYIQQLKEL